MDKKFKIMIIVFMVIITLGSTAAIGFMFFTMQTKINTISETGKPKEKNYNGKLELVTLDEPIISNIVQGEDGIPHIVKISLGFAIDTQARDYKELVENIANKQIIIRDEIIRLLREQTFEMMTRTGENNAQDKLAVDILSRVSEVLETTSIKEVRFGDFFVQ